MVKTSKADKLKTYVYNNLPLIFIVVILAIALAYTNILEVREVMNAGGAFLDQVILSAIYKFLIAVPHIGFVLPYLAWILTTLGGIQGIKFAWNHKPTLTETSSVTDATKSINEAKTKASTELEAVTKEVTTMQEQKKTLADEIEKAKKALEEEKAKLTTTQTETSADASS